MRNKFLNELFSHEMNEQKVNVSSLSRMLGISHQSVAMFLSGERAWPLNRIKETARILHIPLNVVLKRMHDDLDLWVVQGEE